MKSKSYFEQMQQSSFLSGANAAYIDELFERYLNNPNDVSKEWQQFFQQLPKVNGHSDISHAAIRDELLKLAQRPKTAAVVMSGDVKQQRAQAHVLQLVESYRSYGHLIADLDPLHLTPRGSVPDLELSHHQLGSSELNETFSTESRLTKNGTPLKEIVAVLKKTYCETLGFEYMHISNSEQRKWIEDRVESVQAHPELVAAQKKQILESLIAAEGLEKYLGSKYVGQKRFSLEGGDTLIPLLKRVVDRCAEHGVKELVMGMAHRGRLNVLVNILGKEPSELFQEFEGKYSASQLSGDVKYHKGFSSDLVTSHGDLHVSLAFNPSHLEIIDPVVEGSVRARQQRRNDQQRDEVVPLLIHGDAAFAGQGVVMETLNFSQARGYCTGGTVHIVVNNQIGFTTSNPLDARSTLYCTDIAKMVQAPVFHVNGDDPEAVIFAAELALDFRMRFKKDVVIDLVCYRRHGHNEADDPSITQPLMYEKIKNHPTIVEIYGKKLIAQNLLSEAELKQAIEKYRDMLDEGKPVVKTRGDGLNRELMARWKPYLGHEWDTPAKTQVSEKELKEVSVQLERLPKGFNVHPQVEKVLFERHKMVNGEIPFNWGAAEILAYATLLKENYNVRISGQDCGRGTFAHRHAVLYDVKTGASFVPLQNLTKEPYQFAVIDSVLSEEAVLGFEYGFAMTEPKSLVIWEAQFGDFANGAQVVIDQFISSGEQKWGRLCGLVMLLPHGYEGQGPEHSSARLERYMQLCAQHNMQVCVPTTPAQIFHLLRRQMIRPYRKPLVVMTPKSLLRHKLATSTLQDLTEGEFQNVIPEIDPIKATAVKRVILTSGKVYYDLLQKRRNDKIEDRAIIRIEQLYPFPEAILKKLLKEYKNAKEIIWCQEEPQNQGAWYAIQHHIVACLDKGQTLQYAGRASSASPATGSTKLHAEEQSKLVMDAFGK